MNYEQLVTEMLERAGVEAVAVRYADGVAVVSVYTMTDSMIADTVRDDIETELGIEVEINF